MFKKRNLKGQNFAQEMGAVATAHRLSSTDDTEEPVVQKKLKTVTGSKFSVKISILMNILLIDFFIDKRTNR